MGNLVVALIVGSVGSVALAGTLLLLNEKVLDKVASYLLSLAGGTLLGAAFIGMLPKAIQLNKNHSAVIGFTLLGIVVLFILEKVILKLQRFSGR